MSCLPVRWHQVELQLAPMVAEPPYREPQLVLGPERDQEQLPELGWDRGQKQVLELGSGQEQLRFLVPEWSQMRQQILEQERDQELVQAPEWVQEQFLVELGWELELLLQLGLGR